MDGLTEQEIAAFASDFQQNKKNQVLSRAAQRSGLLEASFNSQVSAKLNRVFSIELKNVDNVTDQKRSGRCWEFATLNVLRHYFGKKYHVKDFTFSQNYNFFWDKLERANAFYNKMIALADRDLDDREVQAWLAFAGSDGGLWPMGINLIKKYGVVPSYAMPESYNANHTAALADSLARKQRKDALVLRKLVQDGKKEEAEAQKKEFLNETYRMIAVALGQPPKKFDLEFRDDNKKYHLDKDLTPRGFVQKYLGDFPFDDYVLVLNSPNFAYNKLYHQGLYDNVQGGQPIVGLNLPIEDLEQAALKQLKNGNSVMFGSDVPKEFDQKSGYMDTKLYDTDQLLGVNTQMSKADRLATGEASATHDMNIVGVDEDHGQIRQWKVENSWGDKVGKKGFFVMSPAWFKTYVFDIIINKKYLTPDQQELLKGQPIDLKPWQHTGL